MPRGGAHGHSPAPGARRAAAARDPDSQVPWKCFFALNMLGAMACAMHNKPDGVLLMCLAVFIMAMAMQYCLDLEEDDEAAVPKFLVGIAVVWACAYQLDMVKVHTSLASLSAGASVDHAKLKKVLQQIPQVLEAASRCRKETERTAYLQTLNFSNAFDENATELDWAAWLFVVTKNN